MKVLVSVLCIAVCFVVCSAHLCLIEPKQRGSMMNINKAGSDDCILLTAPCGGRPAEEAQARFKRGNNITVVFQKNLDHWAKATPGYFNVALLKSKFVMNIALINDTGEPSLTLYTAHDILPKIMDAGDYMLQVTYVTKNPQAPPMFYQCADVYIM